MTNSIKANALARTPRKGLALLGLIVAMLVAVAPALAQEEIPPPKHAAVDGNGVDLVSGGVMITRAVNSIGGSAADGLSSSDMIRGGASTSSLKSYVKLLLVGGAEETSVVFMGSTERFYGNPDIGADPAEGARGQLTKDATDIIYTLPDGTVARFMMVHLDYGKPELTSVGYIKEVAYPTGEVLTFSHPLGASNLVESSLGYAFVGSGYGAAANLTQGACTVSGCSGPSYASQQDLGRSMLGSSAVVNGSTVFTVTNPAGGAARSYTITSFGVGGATQRRVTSYSDGSGTWTYSYADTIDPGATTIPYDGIVTTTVTDPLGHTRVVKSRRNNQHIISDTNGVGQTTSFQYTADDWRPGEGTLYQITAPEGNRTRYEFDNRLNVTAMRRAAKGSETFITVAEAAYPATCSDPNTNAKTCNRPLWIKDARGAQTDFTYSTDHGGVLTITKPAGPNGVRPQTRYTYGQFTAMYVRGGVMQAAAAPVWRLTQTSTCQTQATCAGTADEVVTTYAYEPSATANNVRLLSTTTRSGDSALVATTTYAYNARGDVVSTDGPLPGAEDVVQTYYDASRWKIGEVGPDPDGTGALLHRANKTSYRADGKAAAAYTGAVANRAEATFNDSFQILQAAETVYDPQARPIRNVLKGLSGANLVMTGVTDQGYDPAGRAMCSTVRMNAAAFSATPGACVLGAEGSDGPDRITYTTYDNADRVTQVASGYLAPTGYVSRVEKTVTYTDNGQEQTVADGKGNLTTYEYDGFDRLAKVRYPNVSGTGSSTTDYEEYSYDPANNRTSWRRRNGATVTFTYDALNRALNGLRGEAYSYDNLGRRTLATYAGGSGSATYDALGRMKTETTNSKTLAYQYDLAGRRIRITWPDNVFVTYDYDLSGAVTAVRENGAGPSAFTLALLTYDNLGRRTATNRANSAQSAYGYDAASRLNSLGLDLPAGPDQNWIFTYTAAGQVKSRIASNSVYEWGGAQAAKSYTVNSLNQYATVAGAAIGYDLRGNLRSDGARTYCYGDLLNNLSGVWSGAIDCAAPPANPIASLSYEPTGRLWQVTAGATTTNLLYSGPDLVAEYDAAGTLLRRYVPGPGTDEPMVWYEGAGVSDRRFLLADPQGSIVAVVNGAGTNLAINTYDEYGVPAAGNLGRFRYTGQAWIPEVGLYHYKARAYSPTLGRFLQTDPIGYGDGLNWYAYVGNDPLNKGDPTGTLQYWTKGGFCESGCEGSGPSAGFVAAGRTIVKAAAKGTVEAAPKAAPAAEASGAVAAALGTLLNTVLFPGHTAFDDTIDQQWVVRGGTCTAILFCNGSGVSKDQNGILSGISVQTYPKTNVDQLSRRQWIPNNKIGVTTLGAATFAGARIVPSPTPGNPYHATLSGVTAEQAAAIFSMVVNNPNPKP